MFFGRGATRGDPRLVEWVQFAEDYEFVSAPELAERLVEQFSLGEGELVPIYAFQREGQPLLVAFDQRRHRTGPAGSVLSMRTFVAVRGRGDQIAPPMRASARRGKVLENLEAGRSGAERLDLEHDQVFDDQVSVYTREVKAATAVLTPVVREVLARLLGAADRALLKANGTESSFATTAAPSLVVGNRNLLLCIEPRNALPVNALGALLADMLSLNVALEDAGRRITDALLE